MELLKLVPWAEILKIVAGSAVAAEVGRRVLNHIKSRSSRMFKVTSKLYREINACVKKTTIEMIARRTTITEIHNGGVWLSNHPIYRITITHDAPRISVKGIAHKVQEQITTGAMMALLVELDRNKVKYIANVDEEQDPDLKRELVRYGSKSMWMYMLKNRKGRPMGIFTVSFDRPNMINTNELDMLMRRVHHIEDLMQ